MVSVLLTDDFGDDGVVGDVAGLLESGVKSSAAECFDMVFFGEVGGCTLLPEAAKMRKCQSLGKQNQAIQQKPENLDNF